MSRTLLGLTLLAVLAVLGCADAGGPAASGPRPATAQDVPGRWYPADGAAGGRAFAEFTADGGWTGSDGCNGQRGSWSLGDAGALTGTAGPSTLIACENVPIARWVATAASLAVTADGDLVFRDAAGTELARMVRAPA